MSFKGRAWIRPRRDALPDGRSEIDLRRGVVEDTGMSEIAQTVSLG
jgi:hypothetical protein